MMCRAYYAIPMVLVVMAILNARGNAETIEIIAPNKPLPAVVACDNQTDREAAIDLCNYLSRVTGREISPSADVGDAAVVIHLGRSPFALQHAPEMEKLLADGFVIKGVQADGKFHLILAGRMAASTQWAVERFLKDHAGVHWLFPDPVYGEIVPSRPTLEVDRNLLKIVEPDYISRTNVGMYYYFNPSKLYLRGGPVGYDYGQHAVQFMFSEPEFKAHPEWFAYFNGKRNWWSYGNGWQICSTNPETVQHAVKYVLRKVEENPLALMVSIGNNDGWGECECEKCTAFLASADPPYTVSERWWTWVNQVAREVKKVHPELWVESLAYAQASDPPRFKLEDNVAITKTIVLDKEVEQAEQWGKVCKSVNLYSYMYGRSFLGFRHYPHAARDFLKWGHDKLGARAHVTEGGGDWSFDGPKYHYLQAIQWDVDVDVDALMNEFCQLSYGDAAGSMRQFWDRLEEVYERRKPAPHGMTNRRWLFYQWVGWATSSYLLPNDEMQDYTHDDVVYLDDCIARARSLASKDDVGVQFRLERVADAWGFFRTSVVSFTSLYNTQPPEKIEDQSQFDAALAQVKALASLRDQRTQMLRAVRSYPVVNPRISDSYFWAVSAGMTIYSHESNLLDETCSAMTRFIVERKDTASAAAFWTEQAASDDLRQAAETQLYLLANPAIENRLANGDFETGDMTGWDVKDGVVSVTPFQGDHGRFAARMEGSESVNFSQKLAVSPMERYRLGARVKYLETPPEPAVPAEAEIEFYAGEIRIWEVEPTRTILRTTRADAGWLNLASTVTVPPGATSAIVRFRCTFSKPVIWDDIRLEKIHDGVDSGSGELVDRFSGSRLDESAWFQSPASPGTRPPTVDNGWLKFDAPVVYSLTSYRSFNHLLEFSGDQQYRLRFRAAREGSGDTPAVLDWSVQAGTGVIRTLVTGMYWTHWFPGADRSTPQFYGYAAQGDKNTHAEHYTLASPSGSTGEIWYTLDFDPKEVTVYASADGFDASDASRIARYPHGIQDLKANGDVYFKMHGRSCRIADFSLTSAAPAEAKAARQIDVTPQGKDPDLTMPGVTDK